MHRSYLYVPGDRPDRLLKALRAGCDAIIADLEDGVAQSSKESARDAVRAFVQELGPRLRSTSADEPTRARAPVPEILVRVNPGAGLRADLEAVVTAGTRTVYLPKATAESVAQAAGILEELDPAIDGETDASVTDESGAPVRLVALIESARGILDAESIALHPRVTKLAIGEADLSAELGIHASADRRELHPMRAAVVLAAAAGGLDQPTGPVYTDIGDPDGLRADTEALRWAGFGARSAIHPSQVGVINDVFTPGATELADAEAVLARFERSVELGEGVCVDDRGRMIDEAVVRSARRTLGRATD